MYTRYMDINLKWAYDLLYRVPFVPIEVIFGTHGELADLLDEERISPCRTLEFGCGVGRDAIFLAQQGFDVTGIDFSPTAIKRAKRRAQRAGVDVAFYVDDIRDPKYVRGVFDFVVDYGAFNDLNPTVRDAYQQVLLNHTQTGSSYFLMVFNSRLGAVELEQRFTPYFEIERLSQKREEGGPRQLVFYYMKRN